jgi:ectoine hydroxylase-related dioxygenase (phytanoyl-CoA dioxygenase family)
LLFDKTPDANWKVAWHQDLTIAVRERIDVPGYGPWSVKGGVVHVQPPTAVLEQMLAVRVHVDACGPENGPLRVLPGSHREGRLSQSEVDLRVKEGEPVRCAIARGGVLAFRPLLLHSSSQAAEPARRRVVHFEFAAAELSGGLAWQTRR